MTRHRVVLEGSIKPRPRDREVAVPAALTPSAQSSESKTEIADCIFLHRRTSSRSSTRRTLSLTLASKSSPPFDKV